jgi:uncharacterized protein YlxP (DUF503 family)
MVIGLLVLELHIPGAQSLKDKRHALRGIETRVRDKFNVSLAEVEYQDLWQRARLAVVAVNTDQGHLEATLRAALSEVERSPLVQVVDVHMEGL